MKAVKARQRLGEDGRCRHEACGLLKSGGGPESSPFQPLQDMGPEIMSTFLTPS